MKKFALVFSMLGFFAAGYITGSIHTRSAMALELGSLSQTVSSLKSLGKTVLEMQDNVNKLQKNINDVKKVRDDISTYQGVYNRVTGKGQPQQDQQQLITPELEKGINDLLTPQQKQQTK
jgi:hypothetical protein